MLHNYRDGFSCQKIIRFSPLGNYKVVVELITQNTSLMLLNRIGDGFFLFIKVSV